MKTGFTDPVLARVRQNRYIYLTYVVLMGVFTFYLYRFNFVHNIPEYNIVLIPAYVITAFVPFMFRYTKNLNLIFSVLFASVVVMGAVMIYASGGVKAPGIFWLSLAPIVGGLCLRKRGVIIGSFLLYLIIIIYLVADSYGVSPNFIASYEHYIKEKRVNILLFSTTLIVMTYYWMHFEEKLIHELNEQKQNTDELVRLLTHDVASPLQAISMRLLYLREKTQQNPETLQNLAKIELQVKNMSELLSRVRSMRALDDDKLGITLDTTDVCSLIKKAAQLADERASGKTIEIKLNFEKAPILVKVDRTLFVNQVLLNIISNSIKFSNPGAQVSISAHTLGDKCIIRISDQGIGIPEHLLKSMFSINEQTSRKGTDGESGTGFGMPLAKKFVERLNGSIEVFSKEVSAYPNESGTEVTIRLPLADTQS